MEDLHTCGTTYCIRGYAEALYFLENKKKHPNPRELYPNLKHLFFMSNEQFLKERTKILEKFNKKINSMKDQNYFLVSGWMINQLNLSGTELLIYAIIYGFSQDGNSKFTGSLRYLENATNASRSTVKRSLNELCEKKYLTKEEYEINNIKLCKYISNVEFGSNGIVYVQNEPTTTNTGYGQNDTGGGFKMTRGYGQNDTGGGFKMNPNNIDYIIDNNINNKDNMSVFQNFSDFEKKEGSLEEDKNISSIQKKEEKEKSCAKKEKNQTDTQESYFDANTNEINNNATNEKKPNKNTILRTDAIQVLEYLNEFANKNYKILDTHLKFIQARLNEKYSIEEMKEVIQLKTLEWKDDPKMAVYICPETLFGNKFHKYFEAVKIAKQNPSKFKKEVLKEMKPNTIHEEIIRKKFGNT